MNAPSGLFALAPGAQERAQEKKIHAPSTSENGKFSKLQAQGLLFLFENSALEALFALRA